MRFRCHVCGQETMADGYPDEPCPDCGPTYTDGPGDDPWTWVPEVS